MSATRANGRGNGVAPVASRISGILEPEGKVLQLDETWLDFSMPRAEIMEISPEIAELILETRNANNRNIAPYRVNLIAEELQGGRWKVNGETIIFDVNGILKNGQHRLTACLQVGIPLVTWVVFGVDPGCFDTLDRGRNRKTSDDMTMRGEKNAVLLPAVLAMVWLDENDQIEMVGRSAPSQVLQEVLDRHASVRDHVDWVSAKKFHRVLTPSVAAFLRYRFSEVDPVAAAKFFDDLRYGVGLEAGDPVLCLRNRMNDDRASRAKLKKFDILVLTIKAWNHRRAGRKVNYLTWRAVEGFPPIN